MTLRSVSICCVLLAVACRSKPTGGNAGEASASAAPSALVSVDPWAGCTVLGAGDSIIAQCAWPRSLTRVPLPAMTADVFEKSSQRFFDKVAKNAQPVRDDFTSTDGKKVPSSKASGQRTNRSGATAQVHLRTAGFERPDKSGLFLTCVAVDDATCVADIQRMIASPPPPTKSLK